MPQQLATTLAHQTVQTKHARHSHTIAHITHHGHAPTCQLIYSVLKLFKKSNRLQSQFVCIADHKSYNQNPTLLPESQPKRGTCSTSCSRACSAVLLSACHVHEHYRCCTMRRASKHRKPLILSSQDTPPAAAAQSPAALGIPEMNVSQISDARTQR